MPITLPGFTKRDGPVLVIIITVLAIIFVHKKFYTSCTDRAACAVNTFENYKQTSECTISSLDLHQAHDPLCTTRKELLQAMSWGGRAGGFDMPYTTRGCDMRWFTTAETCSILSRFDRVHIVGDSMMRHLSQGFMILLRQDLATGARATWRDDDPPGLDCSCRLNFDDTKCNNWTVVDLERLSLMEPGSIRCPRSQQPASIHYSVFSWEPLAADLIEQFVDKIETTEPNGREVFVIGNGAWIEFNAERSQKWLTQLEEAVQKRLPAFSWPNSQDLVPKLFVTPSVQGYLKPAIYTQIQNSLAVMRMEREMSVWCEENGYEHLGLYNLTAQAHSPDGTHASMESNIMKAMMVLNWLNMLNPASA